jgi:glyoxylase-like metal-dependent hydrolase (beta-lactamase superfamily II)/8-oxo-dGTP pyrophosphatase MutT (NUDIX family)
MKFLGGYWTFPGGRLEEEDSAAAAADQSTNDIVAGCVREMHEELGLVLPSDASAYVSACTWVTPDFIPIRFAATYLLHELGEGQEPDHARSQGELVDGCWVTPAEAAQKWRSGEWLVPSPVLRTLEAFVDVRERGLKGAAATARFGEEVAREDGRPRLWFPVKGVGICPLRSPTLPPATHTNAVIVAGERVVVIDPAGPDPAEQAVLFEALDSVLSEGRTMEAVLLTHHHGDHIGAAAAVAQRYQVDVAAHTHTATALLGRCTVTRMLADGDLLDLGGRRLRCIFTPGHAPGHLCFVEEVSGVAAVGDMLAGIGTILIDPSEGDMGAYLRSLDRLRDEAPTAMIPAHGPTIANVPERLAHYRQHRLWREQRVVDALRSSAGATLDELTPEVYQDVPEALHPLAARSLLAHLLKLVDDGRARENEGRWEPVA